MVFSLVKQLLRQVWSLHCVEGRKLRVVQFVALVVGCLGDVIQQSRKDGKAYD